MLKASVCLVRSTNHAHPVKKMYMPLSTTFSKVWLGGRGVGRNTPSVFSRPVLARSRREPDLILDLFEIRRIFASRKLFCPRHQPVILLLTRDQPASQLLRFHRWHRCDLEACAVILKAWSLIPPSSALRRCVFYCMSTSSLHLGVQKHVDSNSKDCTN